MSARASLREGCVCVLCARAARRSKILCVQANARNLPSWRANARNLAAGANARNFPAVQIHTVLPTGCGIGDGCNRLRREDKRTRPLYRPLRPYRTAPTTRPTTMAHPATSTSGWSRGSAAHAHRCCPKSAMSSPRDPYGEEACWGDLRRPRRQKALVLTSTRRALAGSMQGPSSEHVLWQHLR